MKMASGKIENTNVERTQIESGIENRGGAIASIKLGAEGSRADSNFNPMGGAIGRSNFRIKGGDTN